jgi:hypothetical protein
MILNCIEQQRLEKLNKGFNFFMDTNKPKHNKHYIRLYVYVEQDLVDKDERLRVESDIFHFYSHEEDYKGFLEELKKFCNKPFAEIILSNRKDMLNDYHDNLSELRQKIRTETINFSDIDITIMDLAKNKLAELKLDFIKEVKKILDKQKNISKENQDKINDYVFLREELKTYDKLIEKKNWDNYSYSSKPTDNTQKVRLNPQEYNDKLKQIEIKIRKLEKDLGLDETDIKYIEIKEKISFKEWLKQNEGELRDNFKNDNEDENMTFEEYAEQSYEFMEETDEEEYEEE